MNNKIIKTTTCVAFTFAALLSVSSCSLFKSNSNLPHFSGEGKCPVCGTIVTKHQANQQSTVDKTFLQELLNKDYSIREYKFDEPKRMTWKDDTITTTQEELVHLFKSSNVNGSKSIVPVNTVFSNSVNDLFMYFTEDAQGVPTALRLCVQYYADDPLNYNEIIFTIDGFDYKFKPINIKRGKGEGIMIWEQSDDELRVGDKDLVYALSHCQYWAQAKLRGVDGMVHIKSITKEQLAYFRQTLELFLLRGGSFK